MCILLYIIYVNENVYSTDYIFPAALGQADWSKSGKIYHLTGIPRDFTAFRKDFI